MKCDECRFWSEMLAKSVGEHIQAMCICEASPQFMKYTLSRHKCENGMPGHLGAIDAPGNKNAYSCHA